MTSFPSKTNTYEHFNFRCFRKNGLRIGKTGIGTGACRNGFRPEPLKAEGHSPESKSCQGNVADYPVVEYAVMRQDAVLSTLGASNLFKYDQSVVDGIGNCIKAMEAKNIRRFIYMSFVGVKESRNKAGFVIKYIAPKLLSTEIKGHEIREGMILQSQLHWTIAVS